MEPVQLEAKELLATSEADDSEIGAQAFDGEVEADSVPRGFWKRPALGLVLTVAAALVATMLLYGDPHAEASEDNVVFAEASETEFVQEYSTSSQPRCISCKNQAPYGQTPFGCTLDNKIWIYCPNDKPYFSEKHCGCVRTATDCFHRRLGESRRRGGSSSSSSKLGSSYSSSSQCQMTTYQAEVTKCTECFTRSCKIKGSQKTCPSYAKYYEPKKGLCASMCESTMDTYKPPKCETDTKGTCKITGCSSSRGKADCVKGKCICKKGYCQKSGTCYKEGSAELYSSCSSDTGKKCSAFASCDKGLGKTAYCGMSSSYKCKCDKGYCFDKYSKKCVQSR
eukprot:TRINITY_DN52935_c0_g1_i1.p1 TRINITY_DN52935_c0_g1~~TRINITY_DN52935_c0_g1_i1.p1  ORF type:complete len:338 (-),score=47.84 TRINITY_DN52935_c0_g1_i1:253-1266(-)